MENKIEVKQLSDRIFAMNDLGATGYLVLGNEKALMIDTMNGSEDLKAVVRTITDLPVMVVNTHGHGDHICGNIFFEEAYIHPADPSFFLRLHPCRGFCKALQVKDLQKDRCLKREEQETVFHSFPYFPFFFFFPIPSTIPEKSEKLKDSIEAEIRVIGRP